MVRVLPLLTYFLDAVTPLYGVVSAGKDNSYGHPHAEVLAKSQRDIAVLSTAESGNNCI